LHNTHIQATHVNSHATLRAAKTSKAVWAKLVKALIHNRQATFTYSLRKQRISSLAIHENLMVAVGEIKNLMLSQFQSHVHSHLRGLKDKEPIRKRGAFYFKTIRKMYALRNE
jgi:hypothetical protein